MNKTYGFRKTVTTSIEYEVELEDNTILYLEKTPDLEEYIRNEINRACENRVEDFEALIGADGTTPLEYPKPCDEMTEEEIEQVEKEWVEENSWLLDPEVNFDGICCEKFIHVHFIKGQFVTFLEFSENGYSQGYINFEDFIEEHNPVLYLDESLETPLEFETNDYLNEEETTIEVYEHRHSIDSIERKAEELGL